MSHREIPVEWDEVIPPPAGHEEDLPKVKKRQGVIVDYIFTTEYFRAGGGQGKVEAIVYDESIGQIIVTPLNKLRVLLKLKPPVQATPFEDGKSFGHD